MNESRYCPDCGAKFPQSQLKDAEDGNKKVCCQSCTTTSKFSELYVPPVFASEMTLRDYFVGQLLQAWEAEDFINYGDGKKTEPSCINMSIAY